MFAPGHLIWIGICFFLILTGISVLMKKKPPIKTVINVSLGIGIVSEIIKVLSLTTIVPMVDQAIVTEGGKTALAWVPTGDYTPYLPNEHLPLELCSLYLIFLFIVQYLQDGKIKHNLLSLMYVSGLLGGTLGVVLASQTQYCHTMSDYFLTFRAWQYFLYHAMIIIVSIYIGFSEYSNIYFRDWKTAALGIVILDCPTFYLNSVLSTEVFVGDKIVGVTHRMNFLSSYINPLGLILDEKWKWFLYLVIRFILGLLLTIAIFSLLLLRKDKGAPAGVPEEVKGDG